MKNGFTLVELLMVMVLVAILVVVALPKYNGALERSRAAEGITILRDASDYANARYVVVGGSTTYPSLAFRDVDTLKPIHFNTPTFTRSNSNKNLSIAIERSSGWNYTLTAVNQNGELQKITCTDQNNGEDCETIGMKKVGSEYLIDMAN